MTPTPARRTLPALLALAALAPPLAATPASEPGPGDPGPRHRVLATLAGEFELTSTFWFDPAAPPEVSRLPARREVILGGRALRLEVGPDAGGFTGTGLMGYDSQAGHYWYAWADTSTTGLSTLTGTVDERGAGTLTGSTPTPVGMTPLRVEVRFEGGEEIHDYFVPGPAGGEMRMLELRYRRRARH